ncbi:sulfatase-like hydrolase/transferase [Roseibium sp. RKSG952]|uniref:sulfatase-like hydrolase/transferase n=1 Tax=Roseibium sp. RKSG952 TaxID=2529384 RepID=UPI0012BC6504|nr:sulfatase-like hydrolase/transferase [Roseibium sp. RKSG952]MTI00031.1 hypothetical protein [Roseibium sp. RKSG952]
MDNKSEPSDRKDKTDTRPDGSGISRRSVLKTGTVALAAGALAGGNASAQDYATSPNLAPGTKTFSAKRTAAPDHPYNMILFISDEEAYHLRPTEGYDLPAREELRRRGTTFHRHYIGSAMCTPSRGVMFSGQPPQINGIYDQMELGYVPSLPKDKPSMGTIFKALGYQTAYFGKFELRKDIIYPKNDINYLESLKEYGFDRFAPDGDKIGGPDQAYDTDMYTGSEAVRWLRTNAHDLNRQGIPWFMVVSFVSPHDIMYADANTAGQKIQESAVGMRLTPPPENEHFEKKWNFPPSPTHFQPLKEKGRPEAQWAYWQGWSEFLGFIPTDKPDMWDIYYNYYLNLIQDNDRNLQTVLNTLSALDLWDSTVVMRTADHGELGGSHGGLRGKGPLPYEEETHVPQVIVHPEHPGGRNCHSITSHLDLIPTLVGMTNKQESDRKKAIEGLPGVDFSSLLQDPDNADTNAVREGILFNYVGLQTVDWHYMKAANVYVAKQEWVPPFTELKPDVSLKGFIYFVFDGRYKFSRYFAPDNFNQPTTLEEILKNNELELYDLEKDTEELLNLALEPEVYKDLILRMNDLMNKLIDKEVGTDDGSFLPRSLFT